MGDVVWRERYSPFGHKLLRAPELDNQAAFTGHIYDEKTGLTYMQARYYDPAVSRFLSIDPVNIHQTGVPAQFNRYSYAGNNPVLWTDPNGECPWCVVIAVIYVADKAYGAYDAYKTAEAVANGEMSAVDAAIEQGESQAAAVVFGPAGRAVAKGRQKLSKASKATKAGDCCFVAGTLVETKDGPKPIENLQQGDQVLSRNPETGETAYKSVTAFIPRHQRVIWTVELSGDEGSTEFFETTDEHPWWIVDDLDNGRWLRTDELQVGMTVTTADETTMTIDAVMETDRIDGTYNITVADFETYFVGENRILVHNCNLASKERTEHILNGDETGGGHLSGTGKPGKSEFPAEMSGDDIMREASDIATMPNPNGGRVVQPNGRTRSTHTGDNGVTQTVVDDGKDIITTFPENTPRNPG